MEQLTLILITALLNGCFTAIALYIGFTRGTEKTVDIALDKIEKRVNKSPTAQRLLKMLEMSDKLFGDNELVENVTRFFKEAADLVSSPEAKNFFKNVAEGMKQLGVEVEKKPIINLPEKPS